MNAGCKFVRMRFEALQVHEREMVRVGERVLL